MGYVVGVSEVGEGVACEEVVDSQGVVVIAVPAGGGCRLVKR